MSDSELSASTAQLGAVDEHAGTGSPGTYGCACVSHNAYACAELRYGYRNLPEPCECLCHNWEDDDE